jgi:hypothetical protein
MNLTNQIFTPANPTRFITIGRRSATIDRDTVFGVVSSNISTVSGTGADFRTSVLRFSCLSRSVRRRYGKLPVVSDDSVLNLLALVQNGAFKDENVSRFDSADRVRERGNVVRGRFEYPLLVAAVVSAAAIGTGEIDPPE